MSSQLAQWQSYLSIWTQTKTAGYCSKCKSNLSSAEVIDSNAAWCPHCRRIVRMSCFQVDAWIMGVLLTLSTGFAAGLWG